MHRKKWLAYKTSSCPKLSTCSVFVLIGSWSRALVFRGHVTRFHNLRDCSDHERPGRTTESPPRTTGIGSITLIWSSWESSCLLPLGNPAAKTCTLLRPGRRCPRPAPALDIFSFTCALGFFNQTSRDWANKQRFWDPSADTNIDVRYEGGGGWGVGVAWGWIPNICPRQGEHPSRLDSVGWAGIKKKEKSFY